MYRFDIPLQDNVTQTKSFVSQIIILYLDNYQHSLYKKKIISIVWEAFLSAFYHFHGAYCIQNCFPRTESPYGPFWYVLCFEIIYRK